MVYCGMSWCKKPNPGFVCNFGPEIDVERLLRIARDLNIPAWIGKPVNGLDGIIGFYVHDIITDLSQFWDIANLSSTADHAE